MLKEEPMKLHSRIALASGLLAAAMAPAIATAAVGDTLTYVFNAESSGNAVPTVTQATLLLTETAGGVDFLLSPNWGTTSGNRVANLNFAFSGEPVSFVDGAGPNAGFGTSVGQVDSGYTVTNLVMLDWPSANGSPNYFDSSDISTAWSLNGASITLADFTVFASATSTKPTPAFGVISMPGATPSNWVAMGESVSPIPEPETYALMLAGLGVVGFVARRRKQRD
jgi:PEP-CTERM motif